MAYNYEYPYTDPGRSNSDWILHTIKQLVQDFKEFSNINEIKYADPIEWDINTQYEKNTIVQDTNGNTYLSKQPVSKGINITNTDYWLKVADFTKLADKIKTAIAVDDDGSSQTTTKNREVGEWVWLDNTLYRVIRDMNIGDAYIIGGSNPNIQSISVEEVIANNYDDLIAITNTLQSHIDDNLVRNQNAYSYNNEYSSHVATKNYSFNDYVWLEKECYRVISDISIGDSFSVGVNIELWSAELGDKDKQRQINDINSAIIPNLFINKNILILGDSISDPTLDIPGTSPVWANYFTTKLEKVANKVTNISRSGRMMIELPAVLASITDWNYDIVIVFLGVNDFINSIPLGNYGRDYNNKFSDAVREVFEKIHNHVYDSTGKKEDLYFISPMYHTAGVNNLGYPSWFYDAVISGFCKRWGCKWLNGYNFPMAGELYSDWTLVDGLHPRTEYAEIMADYIIGKMNTGGDISSYNNTGLILSLENKIASPMNGTLKLYIENETLHIKGRISGTPNSTNFEITSELDFITPTSPYSPPYINGISFGNNNSVLPALIYTENNKLYANIPFKSYENTTIEFDYVVQPNWCNITRAN